MAQYYTYTERNSEYRVTIIPESGCNADSAYRGEFLAVVAHFDVHNDMQPIFITEREKKFYFDEDGNVYKTRKSKEVLFNLK